MVIPTLNAEREMPRLLESLLSQSYSLGEIIVIDSSSEDSTVEVSKAFEKTRVLVIRRKEFNHGLTRDLGIREASGEIVCFVTQDAIPADSRYIENLIRPMLEDETVAMVSGRQMAKDDARDFERLVRKYSYPEQSQTRCLADIPRYGIRTFAASNACSAYRRSLVLELGGFGACNICEDIFMACKMIRAGYKVSYAAEARILHSHNYGMRQQFRRNREIAEFLDARKEFFFGASETDAGALLMKNVLRDLLSRGQLAEALAFVANCAARFLGNRMGHKYPRKS